MPPVSLVVCVSQDRELLERLLQRSAGCYDDLIVVHDGPDTAGVRAAAEAAGGSFFERPRAYQQEPHWPFAWGKAAHDWILRLDVDEFPGQELKAWLQEFRPRPEPASAISGFTCIWPLWNGRKAVTRNWPSGRIFLFNKQRVRFFGMAETLPIPDSNYQALKLVLQHEPRRKSYGVRNILFRKQAYHWRRVIAQSLMGLPTELPCWRWTSPDWPAPWDSLRRQPIRHSLVSLFWFPLCQVKDMLRAGEVPRLSPCLNPGLLHFLLGLRVQRVMRRKRITKP